MALASAPCEPSSPRCAARSSAFPPGGTDAFDADRLYGGRGNDMIVAVGGGRDRIDCGPGFDRVYSDRSDRASSSCERVYRNRTAPSPPRRADRGDVGQVACAAATGGGREAVIACLQEVSG